MKRIVLAIAAATAGSFVAGAPACAEPSWRSLQNEYASTQTQPSLVVRGHGHRGWGRQHFGSLLMFPPGLAALVLRSFAPAPRQSHREAVPQEPVLPHADEAAPPAIASSQVPPTGSSTPWVDPDEPARQTLQ
jgi:hypothetical protein